MNINIREFNNDDIDFILEMIKEGSSENVFRKFTKLNEKKFLDYLSKKEDYWLYVAVFDDEIIGYIDFELGIGGVGILLGIYVKKERRKKGIGTMLLNYAVKFLKEHCCHKIRTEVYSYNFSAKELCFKNKFFLEGILINDEYNRNLEILSRFFEEGE